MAGEDSFFALFFDFASRLLEGPILGDDLSKESKTTVGIPGIPIGIKFEL